jgi:long-chain acyl-CoA synthetase
MNSVETILARMVTYGDAPAMIWKDRQVSYTEFLALVDDWASHLSTLGIDRGAVCAVVSDYSPRTASLFFALMRRGAILVPLLREAQQSIERLLDLAGAEFVIHLDEADAWTSQTRTVATPNDLIADFRGVGSPGLIVFTSGSTGAPKGILHDAERVLRKFVEPRPGWRSVLFLMMDHFGGFNSLVSIFAYGGCGVCIPSRAPDVVARIIEKTRATLLPTTPTFLNLLTASGSQLRHDLSSVRLITYGTEVMNPATLERVRAAFPSAEVKQTYGLSELGVLRSRSESSDSTWVRIGGAGFEVKVIDDVLWIRSEANMVGYLNAPNPFDGEGWLCTGDKVDVRGDYFRILGRESDLIFVGGEKVYPAEVESVLLGDPNVREATVYATPHALMGNTVQARVSLHSPEEPAALTPRLRRLCLDKLARFKVPVRFAVVSHEEMHSERFKKIRRVEP